MTRFQTIHNRFWPFLNKREASDMLNDFEEKIFDRMPWLLDCSEKQQDEVIQYCLELSERKAMQ